MTLPGSAEAEGRGARVAATIIAVLGLSAFLLQLCPPGSWPVGFDVFWNLHLAGRIAAEGLPAALPEAAFTPLATAFADRQLGFHLWLALLGGDEPDRVPYLLQASLLVQLVGFLVALRLLAPRVTPLVLLALPLLSATWLFRLCALRDLPIALGPLIVLFALLAAPSALATRARLRRIAIAASAALYLYLHAGVLLPLGIGALALIGRRKDEGRWALGDAGALLAGLGVALLARPDLPQFWSLLWLLNVRMPLASLLGENPLPPLEYAAYPWAMLLRWEVGTLLLAAVCAVLAWRGARRWAVLLPSFVLLALALFSRRFFEIAGPLLLLAFATQLRAPWRLRSWRSLTLGVAFGLAAFVQLPLVARSAEANRQRAYPALAEYLQREARPGDLVFTFDWADSAGLAWACEGLGLRFTGVTDPSYLWAHDRGIFEDWLALKRAEAQEPVRILRERFGARFVLIARDEGRPGPRAGSTTTWLFHALRAAQLRGLALDLHEVDRRILCRLGPAAPR